MLPLCAALFDAYETLYGRARPQLCDLAGVGAHAPIAGRLPGASATLVRAAMPVAPTPAFNFAASGLDMALFPLSAAAAGQQLRGHRR